jgi:hypothetical protein
VEVLGCEERDHPEDDADDRAEVREAFESHL